jgi:putative endonuclease
MCHIFTFFIFIIMYKVYVLFSKSFDKIYIGYSSNLEERIKSHNELATKGWTVSFRPWKLIHTESFETKKEVMKREKQLKSFQGRQYIRTTLLKSLDQSE